jgi:hemerythrin-like domain-containing protein
MSEQMESNFAGDLLRIHRVVTRSLGVAQTYGQTFAQAGFPDDSMREGFYNYLRSLSSLLNAHHLSEDEIAFPHAQERIPGFPVDHLCADHLKIAGILGEIDQLLEKAASGGRDEEVLAGLNENLKTLGNLWMDHIHLEEEVLSVKTLRQAFTAPEQAELSQSLTEHATKHATPNYLVVPFVLYNLSEEDRQIMASTMPAVVTQELVPVVWKAQWESMKPFLLA